MMILDRLTKAPQVIVIIVCGAFFVFTQVALIHLLVIRSYDQRWYFDLANHKAESHDFCNLYQAGQLARSSNSHHVYDPKVQLAWHNNFFYPISTEKIFYNEVPPFVFPLLIPFGLLPYRQAYVTWCVLQIIVGLSTLWFLGKRVKTLTDKQRIILLMGVMSGLPSYLCVWHGNYSFWILSCFSLYIAYWLNKSEPQAGIAFAFSTTKPQYALAMLVPTLIGKRRRILLTFIVTELVLLALAAIFIGWRNVLYYPRIVAWADSTSTIIGVNPRIMIGLRGFLSLLLYPRLAFIVSAVLLFIGIIPLCWLWWRALQAKSNHDNSLVLWLWALTIIFDLTFSLHSHIHDQLLLAIPAVLTLSTLDPLRMLQLPTLGLRCWHLTFLVYPMVGWWSNFHLPKEDAAHVLFILEVILLVIGYMHVHKLLSRQAKSST